jgi:hypothetical protein
MFLKFNSIKSASELIIKTFILGVFFIQCNEIFAQNVGINSTGQGPDHSAGLDINFSDKGFLPPRVALNSNIDSATIPLPATGLLIYNSASSGTFPNAVMPGYYFNAGTPSNPNWSNFEDADADTTNELQQLSISNDTLYISNGNSVYLGNLVQPNFTTRIGFTATTNWICPVGVNVIRVELWGGAGGGGEIYSDCAGGWWTSGVGGKGGYNSAIFSVSPGQSYSVVVGNGGAAAPHTNSPCFRGIGNGQNGQASSFNGILSAAGGTGGITATPGQNGGPGANGTVLNWIHPNVNYGSRTYIPESYLMPVPGLALGGVWGQSTGGQPGYCVVSY